MEFSISPFAGFAGFIGLLVLLVFAAVLRARYATTLRRRAGPESRPHKQADWCQQIFDDAPEMAAIHRVEPDGRLVYEYMNRSLIEFHRERLPGVDPTAWIGRDLAEILHTEYGRLAPRIELALTPYREAIRSGKKMPVVQVFREADGERIREGVVIPLNDVGGCVTHLLYRAMDFTERRQSENEMRRSAERFASMLATCPVPITVTRRDDGRILAVSDSWSATTGYAREDAIGGTITDHDLWADAGERTAIVAALGPETPILARKSRYRTSSAELRTCLYSASSIWWNDEPAILAFVSDVTDLVRATTRVEDTNARLREEQRLARSMLDNGTDLMAFYRVDGDAILVHEWSMALRRYYTAAAPTIDMDAWIGRPLQAFLREIVGPDEAEIVRRMIPFQRAVGSRQAVSYKSAFPNPVAQVRHWDCVIVPLTDDDGRVTHLFYRAVDITESVHKEEELRALSNRFELLFETSPVPTSITMDIDGRYKMVNPAWCAATGWSRDEAIGRTAIDLAIWDDLGQRDIVLSRRRAGERVAGIPMRSRDRWGKAREILYSAEPITLDGEQGWLATRVDVTDLQTARRDAQASSDRLEKIFNHSLTPIAITRLADGRILAVNDAWLRLMDRVRDEVEGHNSLDLAIWVDPAERERIAEMLSRGEPVDGVAVRHRRRSGELLDIRFSATHIDWKGERAILGSPFDVTELHRHAEKIRELNATLEERVAGRTEELAAANRELESFSYSVSHDLRAPLRWMTGFSATLVTREAVLSDPDALTYAQRINEAARKMNAMVEALLRFSRVSNRELSTQSVDLGAEVASLRTEIDRVAGERRLRWIVGDLPIVRGDSTLLRLVLQNLLENAVKYTRIREEAVIEIGATRGEGEWVVRVKDNGAGFDMRFAEKLFGVFQRMHSDREFEGTGVGLATAQRILLRHGGRIWAEAAPDAGATFRFALPD